LVALTAAPDWVRVELHDCCTVCPLA
jgi:hypothetical protein